MKLTIPGEPVAKGRVRMTSSGIAYTPAKTMNYEILVKELYIINHQDRPLIEGQIEATLKAYFTIPKSATKKKRALMIDEKVRPIKRPDLDNIAKTVLDALNGLAYKDDSQVVSLILEKYYSDTPRVELELIEQEV